MSEPGQTLTERVLGCVRWARFKRYKAMVRSDYVSVKEPQLAAHLGRMLKQLD